MIKREFILLVVLTITLSFVFIDVKAANSTDIELNLSYDDPNNDIPDRPRAPIRIPRIAIEDYTLYFITSCANCTIHIINEDDIVEFSTTIPSENATLTLPSHLSGEYRIEIIRGRFCFWGYIFL